MSQERFMSKSDVCGRSYQHGAHRYEGHRLKLYGDIFACDPCWQGNQLQVNPVRAAVVPALKGDPAVFSLSR